MKAICRPSKREHARGERARLIGLFKNSQLTVREFAVQHGINPGTFGQWLYRRKLPAVPAFREVVLQPALAASWAAEISLERGGCVRLDREAAAFLVTQWIGSQRNSDPC